MTINKSPELISNITKQQQKYLYIEICIVLFLSLGKSAVYSILAIIDKLTRPKPLSKQVTTINSSVTPERPWLDLSYQLVNIIFTLVPVVLVIYLMKVYLCPSGGPLKAIGWDVKRPMFDYVGGFAIAAMIGIPGLGFYLLAKYLGFNTTVAAANLTNNWWTVPILVCAAAMNGILEEVIMLGYLFTRWRQIGNPMWQIVLISAVIRGSYHLYQGFGGFAGNLIMGLVFGLIFLKTKRVLSLVMAHTLLDVVSFVGYSLLASYISWL